MPSSRIFVDTSAWYAILDKHDRDHGEAVNRVQILDRPLLTSNYIFDEILTLTLHSRNRSTHSPRLQTAG